MDLDEAVDELYAVPPEQFIARRRELELRARADGDRSLAGAIGALPKPSTAAWVCNLLAREHRDEVKGMVELGGLLREAQENLAGDELRALNRQRGPLLNALTRQAVALARGAGHAVSSSVEGQVEETLRAAMADVEAGEALRSGRLTSPLSYSGLGGMDLGSAVARPQLRVVPPPRDKHPPTPHRSQARGGARQQGRRRREAEQEEARQAAEAARRRAEERQAAEAARQRRLMQARAAVESATTAAREAIAEARGEQARVEEFTARQEQLQARLDTLTAELARVRDDLGAAGTELSKAQRRLSAAERRRSEAAAARDAAFARLDELESSPAE